MNKEKLTQPLKDVNDSDINELNDTINFAMYLTGHDKETIEQMYDDWRK